MRRTLLAPFGWLYGQILSVREVLYRRGVYRSTKPSIPVIAVGNLTLGGTGKTPMVEYLIRLLASKYRTATLSRGYGRETKGFLLATPQHSARELGDEPFQLYQKFNDKVQVAVGEKRAEALHALLKNDSNLQLVLLDDAYQHLALQRSLNILLCDYSRPFYEDYPIPAGNLREFPEAAIRAGLVVVTKCPSVLKESQMEEIIKRIGKYTSAPVAFTTIEYGKPVSFGSDDLIENNVLLITGIARAQQFAAYVSDHWQMQNWCEFSDHQPYGKAEVDRILQLWSSMTMSKKVIITTEKDRARLISSDQFQRLAHIPMFYIPIQIKFIEGEEHLRRMVGEVMSNA
jgi:tetraacyldisaccharide 4'-kinase